ncbi:MAG: hypothetical protein HRU70_06315 [Phycisphaeraceae bacterium]|nr:MAG: hypothetical protein HRU70_06315 [Phycisphaeraceae bacterium]
MPQNIGRDENGIPYAVKPEGLIVERRTRMGPPPPGHIRITGEPVPDWDPTRPEARAYPLAWTFIGPGPITNEGWSGGRNAGGRVVSIAPHPTDPATCYIGSASGGVWKTTNAGMTWTPLTDTLPILNHGAVALDPQNPETVYAATGEYQTGSSGDGVFRSTDGGATWTRVATRLQVDGQASGLVVDPTNSNIIHVTTSAGYSRTTNGGATWSRRIAANCSALRLHPTNPSIVYVARNGNGLYRSTDAGLNFSRVAGLPTSGYGRVVFDISGSNPNVLYVALLNGGSSATLYKTTDAGATWTTLAGAANFCSPQCWYDAYVAVDPTDENVVYVGGVDPRYATAGVLKSTNGGTTWTEISNAGGTQLHPDHHAMAFGPNGVIWEANDGGIYRSTNGGASWVNVNTTLGVAQLYDIEVHPTSPERMLGGTQDNGTPERTGNSLSWPQLQAGDGGFSVFDFATPTRRYTTYIYLTLYRWNNSNSRNISGPWDSDSTNWISPVVGDPNAATTLVAGSNRVWRTTNASATTPTWNAISTNAVGAGGTINILAVAKGNSAVIYSGSSTGRVFVTTNTGTNWTDRTLGLPSGQIADLIVNPGNPANAYVSNYNTSGPRVLRTPDFGVTWENVTGNLPTGVAARAIEIDFSTATPALYVGSGAGVYHSFDLGQTWTKNNSTFPNANVSDLHIDRINRTITAATYGRGAWRAPLPTPFCAADFNDDGFVDFFDLDAFVNCFEGAPCPPGKSADFNGDGFVDFFDLDEFMFVFDQGC